MKTLTFPKSARLRSPADFKRVYDRKCSVSDATLIVYGLPNDVGHSRIGLSVSRKIGNAVVRNRFKRLYREAFRLTRSDLPAGYDWIMLPRSTREPTLAEVQSSLQKLTLLLMRRLSQTERR